MKTSKKIKISSALFISYIAFGVLSYGNHLIMLLFTLVFTFILTYWLFFKKVILNLSETKYIYVPFIVVLLVSSIINLNFSRSSVYIIFVPLLSYLGFKYYQKKSLSIVFFSLFLVCFLNFYFQPNFLNYYHNLKNEDILRNNDFPEINLYDKNSKKVVLPKDKIIVLDFWTTTCSVCFKKFPSLEKLNNKFKNNNNVLIYAVNSPYKDEKILENYNIIKSKKYTFNCLFAESIDVVTNKLKFNTYPNVIIIKNNKVLFSGYMEPTNNILSYNLINIEDEINKLLKPRSAKSHDFEEK
jgi:thiol-disulfide isomerase/thioredoxin